LRFWGKEKEDVRRAQYGEEKLSKTWKKFDLKEDAFNRTKWRRSN